MNHRFLTSVGVIATISASVSIAHDSGCGAVATECRRISIRCNVKLETGTHGMG